MSENTFADWLNRQLRLRDWSESDLARELKRTPSVVNRWASGERIPNPKSVDIIADVLRVDRDFVLALAGHRPPDIELAPDDPRRDFIAVINKIRWDDPARVRQVRRYLEGLYDDDKLEAAKAKERG